MDSCSSPGVLFFLLVNSALSLTEGLKMGGLLGSRGSFSLFLCSKVGSFWRI